MLPTVVFDTEYGADVKRHGFELAPIDGKVHVDGPAFRRRDAQLCKLSRPPHDVNVKAEAAESVAQLFDGGVECGWIDVVGEQVDIVSEPVDHPVLADGTGTSESERTPFKDGEGRARELALQVFVVVHTKTANSGNRLSQSVRALPGSINSGHTSIKRSRLSKFTWSTTRPSRNAA